MDRQSVYSLSVLAPEYSENEDSRGQIQAQLQNFILEFQLDNIFIYRSVTPSFANNYVLMMYRDQIRENALLKQYYCDVDIAHLISFNEELAHRLVTEPSEIIPLVCSILRTTVIFIVNRRP
jgi:DNA replication licensing factor MCM5